MEPIEWQACAGGQIDADSHGDVTLGVRSGDWTLQLRTDAPELTWGPGGDHGRSWVTARGHAFAASMLLSPWTDGAPDPTRALAAASVGGEAGWIGYGPAGTYLGGRASLDGVFFTPEDSTTIAVPSNRAVGTIDAILGLYRSDLQAWLRAGVDIETLPPIDGAPTPATRAPHLVFQGTWLPDWYVGKLALAPRVEVRAGLAQGQDFLLQTRLGGLNPWVVPLAGAAWGEWWAQDYAAARLGGTIGVGRSDVGMRMSPFVDAAAFDVGTEDLLDAAGLGLQARAWRGRLFADATVGWAPGIERQAGISAVSVYFSLGADWGRGKAHAGQGAAGPPGFAWPGTVGAGDEGA